MYILHTHPKNLAPAVRTETLTELYIACTQALQGGTPVGRHLRPSIRGQGR